MFPQYNRNVVSGLCFTMQHLPPDTLSFKGKSPVVFLHMVEGPHSSLSGRRDNDSGLIGSVMDMGL